MASEHQALTHWGQDKMESIFQTLKCIFLNENVWILIQISLIFVPKGSINNILALVGVKQLSEQMI